MIGDLGGVMDVLIAIVGLLINPYNGYNFGVNFLEKIYFAKTRMPQKKTKILKRDSEKLSKK